MHARRLVLAIVLFASSSLADDPRAEAESLFEEGRALVAKGRYEEACPKFAESYRLEPGVGTLLNLASCYENTGRTASAWARYREAIPIAARSGSPQKEKFARDHAAALEKKLSRLTIVVTSDVPDLAITRDGQPTSRASWGTPIAVDPGEHIIEARAPGRKAATFTVNVGPDGDKQTITVNALETETSAPPPVEPVKNDIAPSPTPNPREPSYWTAPRVFGWSGVAAGSVLVIGGVVLGVIANTKNNDAAANCPTDTTCNRDGLVLTDEARDFALGSTITISAGAVIAAAGVAILLLWGPSRPASAATR